MREIRFRAWHYPEKKMYYRGYQKLTHVLLCTDGQGKNEGRGTPAFKASYQDCELMECTDLTDKNGKWIYEGDILRIREGTKIFLGVADSVPDMFRSRRLHPLHSLLERYGIPDDAKDLEFEVLGNRFENDYLYRKITGQAENREQVRASLLPTPRG